MYFLHLDVLNRWGIFAQKIYNVCTIFCHFWHYKYGMIPTTKRPWSAATNPNITSSLYLAKCLAWNSNFFLVINYMIALYCWAGPLVALETWKKSVLFFHQNIKNAFVRRNSLTHSSLTVSTAVCVPCFCSSVSIANKDFYKFQWNPLMRYLTDRTSTYETLVSLS